MTPMKKPKKTLEIETTVAVVEEIAEATMSVLTIGSFSSDLFSSKTRRVWRRATTMADRYKDCDVDVNFILPTLANTKKKNCTFTVSAPVREKITRG